MDRKHQLAILFYFLFSIVYIDCISQVASFEHYLDEDGLAHNSIRKIVQDENGYIWLATFGGINRFDGINFKTYSTNSKFYSIPDNDITALVYNSSRSCIWAGTNKGLVKINLLTDSISTLIADSSNTSPLSGNQIRSLYLDYENNLWIGTKSKGLYVYSSNAFYHLATPNITYIKSIHIDKQKRLWIGSTSDGIARLEYDNNFNTLSYKIYQNSINSYSDREAPLVYFFYETGNSKIYIGTRVGLYYFDEENDDFKLLLTKGKLSNNEFHNFYRCILLDSNKELWLGTYDGIFKFKSFNDFLNNNYEHFYHDERFQHSLVDNLIGDIFEDQSGVIWIATEHGLDKYDPYKNQFKTLTNDFFHQQKSNAAACFSETYDKKLVIGGIYNGLLIKDEDNYSQIIGKETSVCSITTKDGVNFWIGTWKGELIHYNYKNKTQTRYNLSLLKTPIYSLLQLDQHTLIIGTYGLGILFFDIKRKLVIEKEFLKQHDFPDNINTIFESSHKDCWIGTDDGLLRIDFKNESIIKYETDNSSLSLPHNSVRDIAEDNQGNIWIATRGGICYISVSISKEYSFQFVEDLKAEWGTNIVVDKKGILWFNINNNKLISYNNKSNTINKFAAPTGIRTNLESKRGFHYWSDSLIFTGGTHVIFAFNPSKISTFNTRKEPTLSGLRIKNKVVHPGEKIGNQVILNKDLSYTKSIFLQYDNNNFAIDFFSSNYTNPKDVAYRYRLSPFESKWVEIASNQVSHVQYTNIPPGEYEFEVCSKNSDDIWSKPRLLKIEVAVPYWRSYFAIILYLLSILLVIYFWRRIIINRIELKNELLLEKVKNEKEEMLLNEKLRFFTNISHELKTPLTLIIGPLKQLLSLKLKPELQKQHNLILQNASRLLNLVNQLLDFRKAEAGKLKLKVTETEIVEYTRKICKLFHSMAKEKSIKYEFNCEIDKIIGWLDKDKYDKILYNLLSNAFKYTNNNGVIVVKLEVLKNDGTNDFLKVSVKDNGKGIPKEFQENVFLRFFQVPGKSVSNTGTGIGLALVKNLISVHKGDIWLNSEPDIGSKFSIKIPINKEAYTESEIYALGKQKSEFSDYKEQEIKVHKESLTNEHPKLLVIEDNAELRTFICSIFTSSFNVLEAENGEEGLKQARENYPTIIISDVMMDKMDGFEFCKKLKNSPDISHIPVVLLTALDEDSDIISGYKLGADDYIPKPFEPTMLKTRIESIINNRNLLKKKYVSEINTDVHILSNSPADDNLFSKIKEVVEDNIANSDLNIKLLCSELNMSQSKLYKKLRATSSLTPNEFIQTFRLKKAAELLKDQSLSISEVAYNIGFNDPLYFSKCFRKSFGISPSEYRKK